jgi:hypothetical protein
MYSREKVWPIEVGQKLKGEDALGALNQIRGKPRGVPKVLYCDNGSEFTSQIMDRTRDFNPRFACLSRLLKDLGGHLESLKLLRIQLNVALKRLASAVQLRPWPPLFQALALTSAKASPPKFIGSRRVLILPCRDNGLRRHRLHGPQLLERGQHPLPAGRVFFRVDG